MAKLKHKFSFRLRPRAPYDFSLSVHKPSGWPLFTQFEEFSGGNLWTALHVDGTLVGLRMSSEGSMGKPLVRMDAFTKRRLTSKERDGLISLIGRKLSSGENLMEFYRMAARDPILKHTIKDLYGMQDTDSDSLFSAALLAVSLQMAPMERSDQMMECMIKRYGESAVFDGKRIGTWPTPERMARLSAGELKRKCKLGYRAKYIVAIAKILAKGGFPSIDELKSMKPKDAKKKLMELPGIGDYSADIISPHGGFPIDVWSADVFGKLFYGREPKGGRDAIEKIKAEGIRRWGRWSWMAFFYVVQDLENLSRRLGMRLRLS
jgi:3-methyladenine DNA glycosylase/8-oxoguanine DNA glycosylase